METARREKLLSWRHWLDRSLFPDARGTTGLPLDRLWTGVAVTGLLALAVLLQLARIGFSASLNSLWAEDGQVFLQGALTNSVKVVGSEYAGYLVVFERLVAELASALPLRDAPVVFSGMAALFAGFSGLAVWHGSAGHITNPYLRATLAIVTVLVPVGGLETIDAASYASWYMLFASFWLLVWRPRTDLGAVLAALFIALTALSNPEIWFLLPLAVLRTVVVRDRRDAIPVAGFWIASALQAVAVLRSSYEGVEALWTHDIWTVVMQRVVDGSVLGLRIGGVAWEHLGWVLLWFLLVALLVGLAIGLCRGGWRPRALAVVALPTGLIMFVFSIYQRAVATPMVWPRTQWFADAGRYSVFPVLLIISVSFAILSDLEGDGRRRFCSRASAAAIVIVLVSTAGSFWARELQARGIPPWKAGVDHAAAVCTAQKGSAAAIPTSPPGFSLYLPCSTIDGE
jgi:hypothetical protein